MWEAFSLIHADDFKDFNQKHKHTSTYAYAYTSTYMYNVKTWKLLILHYIWYNRKAIRSVSFRFGGCFFCSFALPSFSIHQYTKSYTIYSRFSTWIYLEVSPCVCLYVCVCLFDKWHFKINKKWNENKKQHENSASFFHHS